MFGLGKLWHRARMLKRCSDAFDEGLEKGEESMSTGNGKSTMKRKTTWGVVLGSIAALCTIWGPAIEAANYIGAIGPSLAVIGAALGALGLRSAVERVTK